MYELKHTERSSNVSHIYQIQDMKKFSTTKISYQNANFKDDKNF